MHKNPSGADAVKRGKDECRLVITIELQFTQKGMKDAPNYDKTAIGLVRQTLSQVVTKEEIEETIKAYNDFAKDNLQITDMKFEAAP